MVARIALLLMAGLAGCGEPAAGEIARVFGEVHLHLYATGTHPAALFVAEPIAVAEVQGDSVLKQVMLPAREEGPCRLVLPSGCPPPCGPSATFVDAGAVHLRGDRGGAIDLTFHASLFSYQPVQQLVAGNVLFGAGEQVTVSGDGAQAPAFSGKLRNVEPLERLQPGALPWAKGAPWQVSWTPAHAGRVQIVLTVSTRDGTFSTLTCNVPDESGSFTLQGALVAALPAAPRDLSLDMSRDQLGYGDAGGGLGVIFHSGASLTVAGHEDP